MKNLPNLILTRQAYSGEFLKSGNLGNVYSPFKNLILDDNSIDNFRTTNLNIDYPVNIEIQPSFDGSVNLLLNDNITIPKLINSRFSFEEGNRFLIVDHEGNNDTNLYTNSNLNLDTRLYKTINKIPKLDFNGLDVNGKMKCGSYHFYFKLADNDGNETDFIAESGLVTCHIGNLNDPYSIRMGLQDEDSKKSIKFRLYNLDSSYDFVKVYYTRTTSDFTQEDVITTHLINNNFPITEGECNLLITGFEEIEDISLNDINLYYQITDSVKTQAQCQNILFLANINKPNIPYKELRDLSLRFIPNLITTNIGNITSNYKDYTADNPYEYYNVNNIYYNLGLWPEEYYRLGIVYIMNDYTLSPVFNTRGLEFPDGEINDILIGTYSEIQTLNPDRVYISYDNDGFINKDTFENSKGVIKLGKHSVIKDGITKSIGIKFNIVDGSNGVDTLNELKKYTKGFFIVRQERIPTIYSQGVVIGKTKNEYGNIPVLYNGNYFTESFLNGNILNNNIINIDSNNIKNKAAIIPEAEIRNSIFNQLFTSTNFKLTKSVDQCSNNTFNEVLPINNYYLPINNTDYNSSSYDSLLTLVMNGLKLTTNGTDYFSAKAGEAEQAWETIDVSLPWTTPDGTTNGKVNSILTKSESLVRGIFGTYVGLSNSTIPFGTIFNVRESDFNDSYEYKLNMFKLRINSSEPYFAISDRISWDDYTELNVFRGDCYICNFTHRMHSNFIDPDLPTNDKIVDINTWNKNYAVYQDTVVSGEAVNRQLITYKEKYNRDGSTATGTTSAPLIIEPSDSNYINAGGFLTTTGLNNIDYKIQGCDKINRADVNTVPLGHWATFKVMSNINLSMRDIDYNHPSEEALFGYKRKFYPYGNDMKKEFKLPDANSINGAANVTLSKRTNFILPDVPFIKNKFNTRIIYSDIHITDAFKNGYRIFQAGHYQDYTKIYGSIVDLKEWYGNLFVTMEHGCMLIPINERAIAAEGAGGTAYINTSNVLPENPKILSNLFGSIWQESIIKTKTGIYGFDTSAKKIWMSDGQSFKILSDLKVQKFLNDNVDLRENDKNSELGFKNVKTHYDKNKGDIIFTFYKYGLEWSLCYNENLQKFITFYSWIPSYSENINNTFFTFNNEDTKSNLLQINTPVKIWKHGQSGIYDNAGIIKPTTWYDTTEPFEFDFVISEMTVVQKIFNNLKLLSNKAEPNSFEFEIVGEGYDFSEYKETIIWLTENQNYLANLYDIDFSTSTLSTLQKAYSYVLRHNMLELEDLLINFERPFEKEDTYIFKKLPFIPRYRSTFDTITELDNSPIDENQYEMNTSNTILITDDLLNEHRLHTQQSANNIKKYGRLRGNMVYLEDEWDIEIKPFNFKYAYIGDNELDFSNAVEGRIRDKYLKVKVKYSGKDLAIIQGIKTLFTISYA